MNYQQQAQYPQIRLAGRGGGTVIMCNDAEIEVSRRRKSAFLELLSSI